jgi:hypothetical protein
LDEGLTTFVGGGLRAEGYVDAADVGYQEALGYVRTIADAHLVDSPSLQLVELAIWRERGIWAYRYTLVEKAVTVRRSETVDWALTIETTDADGSGQPKKIGHIRTRTAGVK